MKKFSVIILTVVLALLCFTACANGEPNGNDDFGSGEITGDVGNTESGGTGGDGGVGGVGDPTGGGSTPMTPTVSKQNVIIVYFSCTDTTKAIAEHIETKTKGTLHKIVPEVPYTEDDLKYYTDCRADREQADSAARPAINGRAEDMDKYNTVFLGYPIWHGQAPRIISTFLESYDFSGKKIVPFCTSHSSGIGSSDTNLHALAPSAEWLSGRRFSAGTSAEAVAEWIDGLDLELAPDVSSFDLASGVNGNAPTVMLNSGYEMPVLGLGTYSLTGETCKSSVLSALSQGYRLIDTAHMYGKEREIGEAIRQSGVPREEIFVITKIYPGTQFAEPERAIQESLDKLDRNEKHDWY